MMFLPILKVCFLHFEIKPDRCIRRTNAAVMNRFCLREVHYLPSFLVKSLAPVFIFGVYKKPLIKQSYLIAARHIHDTVCCVEGMPEDTQKKVAFLTRQYVDALSPSNFAFTNPEVFRETVKSHGQNLSFTSTTGIPESMTAFPEHTRVPTKMGNWMAWYAGGAFAGLSTMAALLFREISGWGQFIDVSPADTNIRPGGSYQLRSAVVDQFGDTLPGQLFTYQSSNPAVVAVSTSGVVHSVGSAGVVFVAVHSGTLQTQAIVRVMDTSIVARLPLNGAPHGAGISPSGVVYITLGSAHALEQLDVPSRTFTGTVQVGAAPTRVLFDPTGATAYVSNQLSQNIGVVNVTSNTETSTIAVSGNPVPVRVSANGQWLYVATDFNRLYRISRSTNRATDSIALPATSHFALLHPNDTLLYVATRDGGRVLEVNVWTWTVLRTFTIGGLTQGMALSLDGHELYVANEVLPEVHVVDLTSGSVADSIPLDGGAFGLALSADGSSLYASLPGVGEVLVLNRTGRSVRKSIIVTGVPREIVVYPTSGVAVVPNEAGWVDIVR